MPNRCTGSRAAVVSITATSLLYYLLVTRPAIRTTLDVHPDGTAAAAGAAAAAPKVRRGDTPRVHPWEGVDVIVDDNEERVREALLATPSAGYAYGMMVYCGKAARVVRYDKYDRQDGVLRATHGDGLTYTWPVALLTVAGAERVPALDPYHPIGVQKGDTLLVSAATEQVIALCRAEPAVGWRASMLPYIGTRAVVLRFDVADRRSGSVRLLHRDGAVHTWPLAATTALVSQYLEQHLHGADAEWHQTTQQSMRVSRAEDITEGEEVLVSDAVGDLPHGLPRDIALRYAGRRGVVKSVSYHSVVVTASDGRDLWWPYGSLRSLRLSWLEAAVGSTVHVVPECEGMVRSSKATWSSKLEELCGKDVTIVDALKATGLVRVSHGDSDEWLPIRALQPVLRPSPVVGSIVAVSADCAMAKEMVLSIVPEAWQAGMARVCGQPAVVTPLHDAAAAAQKEDVVLLTHLDNSTHVWPVGALVAPSAVPIASARPRRTPSPATVAPPKGDEAGAAGGGGDGRRPLVGDYVRLRRYAREEGVLQHGDTGVVVLEQSSRRESFQVTSTTFGGTFWYRALELEVIPRPAAVRRTQTPYADDAFASSEAAAAAAAAAALGGGGRGLGGNRLRGRGDRPGDADAAAVVGVETVEAVADDGDVSGGGRGAGRGAGGAETGRGRGRGGGGADAEGEGHKVGATVRIAADWVSPTMRIVAPRGTEGRIVKRIDSDTFTLEIRGQFGSTSKLVNKKFSKDELLS